MQAQNCFFSVFFAYQTTQAKTTAKRSVIPLLPVQITVDKPKNAVLGVFSMLRLVVSVKIFTEKYRKIKL